MIDVIFYILGILIFVVSITNLIVSIKDLNKKICNDKNIGKVKIFSILQMILSSLVIFSFLIVFIIIIIAR